MNIKLKDKLAQCNFEKFANNVGWIHVFRMHHLLKWSQSPDPGLFTVSNDRVNATRNGFIHRLTSLYNSITQTNPT